MALTPQHHDPGIAVGCHAGDPKTPHGCLPHTPRDLLGQVLRVELVHTLDDGLHELARGEVVGVLGDGDNPHTSAAEHCLEGDGVLPLAGEPGELPDQYILEGGIGPAGLVQHPAELGPICYAAALGLVHILPRHDIAVLLGVVPERPELGGHGKVPA